MYEELIKKAEVLIEALPYIERFNRRVVVIKYGGSAMIDDTLQKQVIQDAVLLKLVGFKPVIVHGGGKEISRWLEKTGMDTHFVNGLRVTDGPTMEIAEMVLNRVNKTLVKMIEQMGVHSIGISGKDGGLLHVRKMFSQGEDIGLVGEIDRVNPKPLLDLLANDYLPVVCPVGFDDNFDTFNINADDAACAIAKALKVEKLAFLSDVPGVYRDPNDESSLIYELPYDELTGLIESGAITGGMLPKLLSCKDAIDNGVSRVHIMDGRIPHCVLLEIFTDQGIGTAILSKGSERFYKG